MLKLLNKTLAREFYAQHAGLFLFIFYLIFGAVEPSQIWAYHKSLLMAISSSTFILACCFLLWALYALKCVLFVNKQQKLASYTFLNLLTMLPPEKQVLRWAQLYTVLLLPVLVYIALVLLMAFSLGQYLNILLLLLFAALLLLIVSFYSYRLNNYHFEERKPLVSISFPCWKKPYRLWPVIYMIKEQTLMLVVCKVLSFLLFKAMLWMFADVGNDVRVALFGLLAAVLSHSILIAMLIRHEASCLAFTKSLPLARQNILFNSILALLILFTPELLLYIQTVGLNYAAIIQGVFFGLAGLFSFKMVLFSFRGDENRYLKFLLFLFFIASLAILGHQILLFSLFLLGFSCWYFWYSYDRTDFAETERED